MFSSELCWQRGIPKLWYSITSPSRGRPSFFALSAGRNPAIFGTGIHGCPYAAACHRLTGRDSSDTSSRWLVKLDLAQAEFDPRSARLSSPVDNSSSEPDRGVASRAGISDGIRQSVRPGPQLSNISDAMKLRLSRRNFPSNGSLRAVFTIARKLEWVYASFAYRPIILHPRRSLNRGPCTSSTCHFRTVP